MSTNKFTCPPQKPSGQGTFSDNLVGFQLVQGGGLTQGNFEFVQSVTEKTNRNFNTGTFSDPISLESIGVDDINQSKKIVENNFKVYPNFDLSLITNFTQYGSLSKRMSSSVINIISYFPAGLVSNFYNPNYTTGVTALDVQYDPISDETSFYLDISNLRNPFEIDFTINSARNLSLKEIKVSELRDLVSQATKYNLYYKDNINQLKRIEPTNSLTSGFLKVYVEGIPFYDETEIYGDIVIRPNDMEVNKVFNEQLDEVENFLLNRNIKPIYTSVFNTPRENDDGTYYIGKDVITWPLYDNWNIDILTASFNNYLSKLNSISESLDLYKTNLISRFLTTGAFREFDTIGQKMEKVLQIYGRSFDETQKFITALSFMTSVNYNVGNDVPSQLLKNFAQTLGWTTNISPITNDEFLASVFGQKNVQKPNYTGVSAPLTPDELNYQYYRNLVLNSAYLFKSKGTRKSIEILLKLIGAPDALIDFNEYVYVADQKININQFNTQYANISGGTYIESIPVLDPTNIYTILGDSYTGFTTTTVIKDVNYTSDEYPMDDFGYPSSPEDSEDYFFQIGSGWFEQTPQHRAPEEFDNTSSVFIGSNPNYQTKLVPYSYGQIYLERFKKFPFMNLGYRLTKQVDNNKSWTVDEVGLRSNLDSTFTARYGVSDDRLVLNVKNVDIFLNPGQGLAYDVWTMSRQTNYPIPNQGLNWVQPTYCDPIPNTSYPKKGGVDSTEINPKPRRKTFFEFAQTFWKNTINVRNRQYVTDGKTGGYPTLQSIYWKYLQSKENVGIENNNFNYQTMIDYVNGLGDYWVRLIEQMVPATTLWNTGVRYENSIFHRQKFIWRRQVGCKLLKVIPTPIQNGPIINPQSPKPNEPIAIPTSNLSRFENSKNVKSNPLGLVISPGVYIPSGVDGNTLLCRPCLLTTNIFTNNCPIESVECPIYPSGNFSTLSPVLGATLNSYLSSNSIVLNDCVTNTLSTQWYVEIIIDGVELYKFKFFDGVGYNFPLISYPSKQEWYNAVIDGLNTLVNFGYDYYLKDDETAVVYNGVCSVSEVGIDFKINMGINFTISCT